MPHVNDLPASIRERLLRMDVAEIFPVVTLLCDSLVSTGTDAGGFPVFGNTYEQVAVDLSKRVPLDESIGVTQEKPIFPNGPQDQSLSSSGVSLPLVNTDERMAAIQTGAIIAPDSIESGRVSVQARIGDLAQFLNLFIGRITGLPGEEFGSTTIEIEDEIFQPIQTELRYEDFGQNSFVQGGVLVNEGAEIIQGTGHLKYYDGYMLYSEDGQLITSFENNKPEVIDLLDVRMKSGARLGLYTIEFQSFGGYRITFPDSTFLQGDTNSIFDSPALTIEPQFWQIAAGQTQFAGTKITFHCRYVVEANPFTLIKNLIEKAFLKNWGAIPSDTSAGSYAGLNLPVLWDTLDELERRFRLIRVYVSVGNKDNGAFEKKPNGKPLNCISLAQQVADHCASSILINTNGDLYLQGPQMFDTTIHDLNDTNHIEQFSLIGLIKDNYVTVNYGHHDENGSYGKKIEHDLRLLPDTPIQEVTFNFPFYKIGPSDNHAAYFARIFKQKVSRGHVRAKIRIAPQFGIAMIPGDRIRVITSKQPRITEYFEVYRVSKSVAFEPVDLEVIRIQAPEGSESTPCSYSFCLDGLCA